MKTDIKSHPTTAPQSFAGTRGAGYGTVIRSQTSIPIHKPRKNEWPREYWSLFTDSLREQALKSYSDEDAWRIVVQGSRRVMKNYTTSFFIVTRFLPEPKRRKVEAIYAAVRFPDEIVDTFPLSPSEKLESLNDWGAWYEKCLDKRSFRELLSNGAPPLLAAFVSVVKEANIPENYYRSFLEAMKLDAQPRLYKTLSDLIDSYIYGSAIVVGYFLAYVYGSERKEDFDRALIASKDLGIALQITNFMRDVNDDQQRSRLYLPVEMLKRVGVTPDLTSLDSSNQALKVVVNEMLDIAEEYYARAQANLDAFSSDSRMAIQACIDVYRELNSTIRFDRNALVSRQSVPLSRKFKVLPSSKYWRLPAAYFLGY